MLSYFLSEAILFILPLILLWGQLFFPLHWKKSFSWLVLGAALLLFIREELLFFHGLSQNLSPLSFLGSYFLFQKSSFFFRGLSLLSLAGATGLQILSHKEKSVEKTIFMVWGTLFCLLLIISNHYLSLYLSLESLSLSIFFLIYFQKPASRAQEGGLKFFLFSILFSLMMLMGMAMIYHFTQTLWIENLPPLKHPWLILGGALFWAGLLGKGGFIPLHYGFLEALHASELPFRFFIITLLPFSVLAFLFLHPLPLDIPSVLPLTLPMGSLLGFFGMLGLMGIVFGSLGALFQETLDRCFSYLSLALIGLLLTGFSLSTLKGGKVFFLYHMVAIFWTFFGLFLILQILENGKGYENIHYLAYFSKCHPWMSISFLVLLLSFLPFPLLPSFWSHLFLWQILISYRCYGYGPPLFLFYGIFGYFIFRFTKVITEKSLGEVKFKPIFGVFSKEVLFFDLFMASFFLFLLFLPQIMSLFQWIKLTL